MIETLSVWTRRNTRTLQSHRHLVSGFDMDLDVLHRFSAENDAEQDGPATHLTILDQLVLYAFSRIDEE